ncbi:MAG: RagB/SusD family nutrient uptake outer membrane protein [Odoribacter sp.]|nr:RagB/SusD family nutrient uptake outer membrane protein [Odoribacter sp.]
MRSCLLYIAILPLLLLSSCNNWLKIEPDDRVMEQKLFSSREGFITALNGVYIEMSSSVLYGGQMLVIPDVLAQYYKAAMPSEHRFTHFSNFNYGQQTVKSAFQSIWEKYYTLIVNCNTILAHCDEGREMLGEKYYNVVKGEALALRAFFHFEVLRIWGPVYKENKEMICMPYAESSKIEVRPLLSAEAVYEKIKRDLTEAESYLQQSDPILTEGLLFSAGGLGEGNDMRYRNLRLNYYAVQALLARVALYCDDQPLALAYARKVVDAVQKEDDELFPFKSRSQDLDDRVYQSELLFAHYNTKRANIYQNYFSNSLSDVNVLRVKDDLLSKLYDETDFRYRYQWSKQKNPSDAEQFYLMKYKDVSLSSNPTEEEKLRKEYRYLVPMIRISELYFIIAECETNPEEALKAINKVRSARAVKAITDFSQLADELDKEYAREFVGEGQLFFYYKRLAKEKIPHNMGWWSPSYIDMSTDKYVLALPDSEQNNRVE